MCLQNAKALLDFQEGFLLMYFTEPTNPQPIAPATARHSLTHPRGYT